MIARIFNAYAISVASTGFRFNSPRSLHFPWANSEGIEFHEEASSFSLNKLCSISPVDSEIGATLLSVSWDSDYGHTDDEFSWCRENRGVINDITF